MTLLFTSAGDIELALASRGAPYLASPAKLGRVLVRHQLERADVRPLLEGWRPLLGLKPRLLSDHFPEVQAHGFVCLHFPGRPY